MEAAQCLHMYLLAGAKTKQAREQLIPLAMDFLRPFFHMALEGEHRLKPYDQLSPAEVHECLAQTTGTQITRIHFLDQPRLIPERYTYFTQVEKSLGIKFLADVVDFIESAFDNYLWMPLEDMFLRAYENPAWQKMMDDFQVDLRLAMLSFLGFALLGDIERQRRMGYALSLMRDTVPLGQDPEQPGTWLLLAA